MNRPVITRKKHQRKSTSHGDIDGCRAVWSEAPEDFRGIIIWQESDLLGALNQAGYVMLGPDLDWVDYHNEPHISHSQIKQLVRYMYLITRKPNA